jgi:hypothetical protein
MNLKFSASSPPPQTCRLRFVNDFGAAFQGLFPDGDEREYLTRVFLYSHGGNGERHSCARQILFYRGPLIEFVRFGGILAFPRPTHFASDNKDYVAARAAMRGKMARARKAPVPHPNGTH